MPEIVPNGHDAETVMTSGLQSASSDAPDRGLLRRRRRPFIVFCVALLACFAKPLCELARLSFHNELYSHVFLIPAISAYLIWLDREKLVLKFTPAPRLAFGLLLAGFAWLLAYWTGFPALGGGENDRLSLLIPAMLLCFSSGVAWFFGATITRAIAFPLGFLIFMSPMPTVLENGIITVLQHGSAEVSYWMLKLSGMSVFREGTIFVMPQVTIRVAPECSGIRSSLVLVITGLLAAQLFLRKPWSKLTLSLAVIPLGILRNALRIFVLAQLAVHVNPDILNSDLHHKGGPIFFVISLAPFFLLVWFLRKQERKGAASERIK